MRKRLLTAALALGLLSSSALALTLGEAREQGRVGETLNGYLAPLRQDKETLALVKQINAARSEHRGRAPVGQRQLSAAGG